MPYTFLRSKLLDRDGYYALNASYTAYSELVLVSNQNRCFPVDTWIDTEPNHISHTIKDKAVAAKDTTLLGYD
jgi:hypothetical protein